MLFGIAAAYEEAHKHTTWKVALTRLTAAKFARGIRFIVNGNYTIDGVSGKFHSFENIEIGIYSEGGASCSVVIDATKI